MRCALRRFQFLNLNLSPKQVRAMTLCLGPGLLGGCCGDDCGSTKLSGEGGACVTSGDCESGLKCAPPVCVVESAPEEDLQSDLDVEVETLELAWVPVPAGTFWMGCSPEDTLCADDEKPVREVTVAAFEMLETEVTEAQFEEVLGWNPTLAEPGFADVDKPLVNFTYSDAQVFCETLGGRFPTEAEWEWAARGGTTTRHYCGDDAGCLEDVAWYRANSGGVKHVVRGRAPNAYGLYDMLGNVREWTADWYDATYYGSGPSDNPTGAPQGTLKVIRGGSFSGDSEALRVSKRNSDEESDDYGWEDVGFRCVK